MSQHPTDLFRTSCGAIAPLELNVSGPGWAGGERRIFEQPFVLLGRHERASLRLEDPAVSRQHAYLQQFNGRVFCVDLRSRTGTRWGGGPRPAGWLRPDQRVQIGPYTLQLAMAAQAGGGWGDEVEDAGDPLQDAVNAPELLPQITVESDNKVVARMRMNRTLVLVGRSRVCRIRLREAGIATLHCSLVRTSEGVWAIDLLNETGTFLDGEQVRWALVKEGSRLQVGPYVLHFSYPNGCAATPSSTISEIRAGTPVESAEDTEASEPQPSRAQGVLEPDGLPVPTDDVLAQTAAAPQAEQVATELTDLVSALQAELDQTRERLRGEGVFREQLADSQAECVRLRDRVRALEMQAAELGIVRAERDQRQAETQTLQTKLAWEVAEREAWQRRLAAAQHQLDQEREAARAAETGREQGAIALQKVLADFASRDAECSLALVRLHATRDELSHSQDEARGLHTELNQARERLQDAEGLRQQLQERGAERDQLCARIVELEERAAAADRLLDRLQAADAERAQLQAHLQAAESRGSELEILNAECVRLRDQVRTLEMQAAELEIVCAERDRWQTETQTLQTKLASEASEREDWQQRFEAAQHQLDEEREAVRAAGTRLELESVVLQKVQADFASRDAEYSAAVQRLQETQDVLDRSQDEARGLQTELNQARERLQDAEGLSQQLAERGAERDQFCSRIVELEDRAAAADRLLERLQAADAERAQLQVHLLAAESRGSEVETLNAECVRLRDQARALEMQVAELENVCVERDQWQAETQTLQTKLASNSVEQERLACLAAELHTAHEERDRLHTDQQASLHSAEQARARLSELERALTETTAAHERALAEARAGWESERQALQVLLDQEGQARKEAIPAAVRDVQIRAEAGIRDLHAQAAAEQDRLRKLLEGAEAQIVCERGMFQEQDEQLRRQLANLQTERDRLAAQLAKPERLPAAAEERSQNAAAQVVEPAHLRHVAILDRIFSEFRGIQPGQLPGQAVLDTPAAIPTATAAAPLSSGTAQDAPAPVEARQPLEEPHGSHPEREDEAQEGVWQKILNFVRSK